MGFIDRPQNVALRKFLFQVHLWAGVAIGLYMIVISVSGSILVFQQDLLDDTHRPAAASKLQISFGEAVQIARQAHPGEELLYLDNRNRNPNVLSVLLRDGHGMRVVNVDRSSGLLVDDSVRQQRHPVLNFLEELHNQLLGGSTGERINGIGGGLLFLMSLTGIVLWWPGRKNWKRALTIMWRARWPRVNFDLHLAFGFWTLLFVALWGITGLYFGFPLQFRNAVATLGSVVPMPQASHWTPGQPVLQVDRFIDKARQLFPGSDLVFLTYGAQEKDGSIVVILSRNRRTPLEVERSIVYLHPSTARVLGTEDSSRWTWGDKLLMWAYTAHFGDFGGLSTKLIWFVLGLVPAGLSVTGYLMWWNRVLKKKWASLKRGSMHASPAGEST
jgi:uncharacterized iron-regulated membrane protein